MATASWAVLNTTQIQFYISTDNQNDLLQMPYQAGCSIFIPDIFHMFYKNIFNERMSIQHTLMVEQYDTYNNGNNLFSAGYD